MNNTIPTDRHCGQSDGLFIYFCGTQDALLCAKQLLKASQPGDWGCLWDPPSVCPAQTLSWLHFRVLVL